MEAKVTYYDDKKMKYQSHEIEVSNLDDLVTLTTGYGETLAQAYSKFFQNVLETSRKYDELKRELASKNVEIYDRNSMDIIIHEERKDPVTYDVDEIPIEQSLEETVKFLSTGYKEKLETLRENVDKIEWKNKNIRKSVDDFIDSLINNSLIMPYSILIPSTDTIQLVWKHPVNKDATVRCNIHKNGIKELYINYGNMRETNEVIKIEIEYDSYNAVLAILKMTDMFGM